MSLVLAQLNERIGFVDPPSEYSLADQPDELIDLFLRPVTHESDSLSDVPLLFDTDLKTVADREPPDKPTNNRLIFKDAGGKHFDKRCRKGVT